MTVTIANAGDNAILSFQGTAGQRVFLNVTNGSVSSNFSIRRPDNSTLAGPLFINRSNYFDTVALPVTGTYTILIDPSSSNTGSVTLTLYDVPPDVNGTIAPGGPAVTLTIPSIGQNARLTFDGTAGQRIFLNVTNGSVGSTFAIRRPDGSTLASMFINQSNYLDTRVLASTGIYSITVDPSGTNHGSVTLTLYDVPPDVSGTILAGGPAVTVAIPNVGQNARLMFDGTAGQRIFLSVTNGSVGSTFTITRPDGSTLASKFINQNNYFDLTLAVVGVYSISIDPAGTNVGSVTLTLRSSPVNTALPQIFGLADVGETLTVQPGSWWSPPNSTSYQWLRCDAAGNGCADLFGSQAMTYLISPDGFLPETFSATVRVRETASNDLGATSAISKQTPIVLAPLDQLALRNRPALLFDSREPWRPLEIISFLNEQFPFRTPTTHQICDLYNWGGTQPGPCVPMTDAVADMAANNTDHSYIDISGDTVGELGTPNSDCWRNNGYDVLLDDCNSGPATAIYFQPGQDSANYRYLDYWWFLRDNDVSGFFGSHDDHEGDWEGVTVALDGLANSGAPPIAFVSFAAHETSTWFPASSLAGGSHPYVYSANGTHASYPDACSSACTQPPGSEVSAEASHDGLAAWGDNDEAECSGTCVKRLGDWWTFGMVAGAEVRVS